MQKITMFNAKTHFSEIIARVQRGEQFVVTNRGVEVARIVPKDQPHESSAIRQKLEEMRNLAKEVSRSGVTLSEIEQMRKEGRS